MKKSWKTFWIICGSVAGAGAILLAIGILAGGLSEESREAGNAWFRDHTKIKYSTTITNTQEVTENRDTSDTADTPDASGPQGTSGTPDTSNTAGIYGHHADPDHGITYTGIRSLDIECGALEVQIETYDGEEVLVDKSGLHSDLLNVISCRQDDEELEIYATGKHHHLNHDPGVLYIFLPKTLCLEEFSAAVGAGVLYMTGVEAEEYSIDVGAGEVHCSLPYKYDDYDYDISCGMGEVTIGSKQYGGLAQDVEIDNGRGRCIDIECGMGEVNIQFQQ